MIDFQTIGQCLLAVAASWCGTAEQVVGLSPQIEYWQRVGGVFSGVDESDLKWDSLFANAIAHDCLAERPHDGWSGDGVPYATDPRDWLSAQWLPSSEVVGWSLLIPGDVIVWRVGSGNNPGAFRVGIYESRWGGGAPRPPSGAGVVLALLAAGAALVWSSRA